MIFHRKTIHLQLTLPRNSGEATAKPQTPPTINEDQSLQKK
jgi:hypothetical protein